VVKISWAFDGFSLLFQSQLRIDAFFFEFYFFVFLDPFGIATTTKKKRLSGLHFSQQKICISGTIAFIVVSIASQVVSFGRCSKRTKFGNKLVHFSM
jgi:hypothetical protein